MIERVRRLWGHALTVRACQIVIGLVFAVAGLAKIGDPGAFVEDIHNFRLVPVIAENLVAVALPWVELVAAIALILGVRARAAAVVTTGLMAVFTVAVVLALGRGLDIECGCFGTVDGTRVGLMKIAENVALFAVSLLASGGGRWRADPAPSGRAVGIRAG